MSNKKFDIQHLPFMGLVLLIAGFSLYGIVNSSISLGNYTREVSASVVGADDTGTDAAGAAVTPERWDMLVVMKMEHLDLQIW